MLRIIKSLIVITAVSVLAVGATSAYFSDQVTSEGNTFAAGTLVLNVDGQHSNVAKFNVANLRPGSQPKGSYTVSNVGTINGYLDIENISVTSQENACNAAETLAGDTTCGNPGVGEGELQDVLNITLFIDRDGDGWFGAGDTKFYNGKVKDLPSSFSDLNEPIAAGSSTTITAIFDWWTTGSDNLAQGDSFTLDLTFELAQTANQ